MSYKDLNYNELIQLIQTISDSDELSNILEELKEYPLNEQLKSLYNSYIEHDDSLVRCIAFESLAKAENPDKKIAQKAIEHLNDEDIVATSCVELLAEYRHIPAISSIKNLLGNSSAGVRCVAAEALGDMECQELISNIIKANEMEKDDLAKVGQAYGIYMLGNTDDKNQAVKHLIELLYSENVTASYRAMNNLINILNDKNQTIIYKGFQDRLKESSSSAFELDLEDRIRGFF
ncbi:hypothetical protein LMxysn_0443 [Listeria monocytogenes]|uniref:HEAT repeat domain-containing protein n=1 Tax=Listeria monocytogenes TaxID=1639 RepID=UPI000A1D4A87|nr:fibronectin-binding protein [Listeria monocytogenes]ARM72078.1 hypothetical protein LMxysn_0443 [Listeria monocytogenes]